MGDVGYLLVVVMMLVVGCRQWERQTEDEVVMVNGFVVLSREIRQAKWAYYLTSPNEGGAVKD